MHPELFTLPGGITIKTYGFFLMVGFLSAVWLAMRRAQRVKADSDRILDLSFLALIFGVGGARFMYVVHYWRTDFADAPNRLWAIVDIRLGGLEFLGGIIGAMAAIVIYLLLRRQSIRLHLDIMAPGAMWGLAFGRLGCFFNGCCFGGLCMAADGSQAQYPWAVQFPYGSPAHVRQWEERRTTIPAELVSVRSLRSHLVPAHALAMSVERRESINQRVRESEKALAEARAAKKGSGEIRKLQGALEAAKIAQQKEGLADVAVAQRFPSRQSPERISSVSELEHLAGDFQSLPVHPAQLYASVHAILLSGVLSAIFYRRKRHGLVIGMLLVLYPIGRVMLEIIRTDNPHDVAGLTVSQSVSLAMFVVGVAYLIILYKLLPQRSPAAAAARPKDDTGSQKHGD